MLDKGDGEALFVDLSVNLKFRPKDYLYELRG